MKEFWIRVISLIAVIEILIGYHWVLETRAKDDEIARLQAQVMADQTKNAAESEKYEDGIYHGEGQGFGGTVAVDVTVQDGKITAINVVSAEKEDSAYLTMAEDIIPKIIEAQSTEVDTISGATFSSTGIRTASAQALEKAVK